MVRGGPHRDDAIKSLALMSNGCNDADADEDVADAGDICDDDEIDEVVSSTCFEIMVVSILFLSIFISSSSFVLKLVSKTHYIILQN